MTEAFKAVKSGRLNTSAAARKYGVPRMTLADRLKGRVPMNATWGNTTALTNEEENSLVEYIDYMAKRGFPLTIGQITGFAWCIVREHGKGDIFKKAGPSRKWWRGFKSRHPQLGLRRPDSLDRGRASMGNVSSIREYFKLLEETLETNNLHGKPHLIFNCDEAALYLNKAAGQRVVVPTKQKHAHSISAATSEHITVHCCVNAAGGTVPPMIIFTKSFPGGAYHKKGHVNATYATSDTGFMDQQLYCQWFEKTFLKFAPAERPLLLIQDGASSHISCSLIKSAIANDVILLCLPPKTTHITQPLDVAVYRKMKLEAANIMSQAKLIKSDLWVAKKHVSAMFKIIYENSFTMRCITEGFRKCGIHPFNPNAVDKTLILRSCDAIDEDDIDLSICPTEVEDHTEEHYGGMANTPCVPLASSSPNQKVNANASLSSGIETDGLLFEDMSFIVGDDGILTLDTAKSTQLVNDVEMTEATECPPELALAAIECSLTPRKKRKYHDCLQYSVDLPGDSVYQTWKKIKIKVVDAENVNDPINEGDKENIPCEYTATKIVENDQHEIRGELSKTKNEIATPDKVVETTTTHPLVRAGLIPKDLAEILVTPTFNSKSKSSCKSKKKARVLTTKEVEDELIEKEKLKQEKEEAKQKSKHEKEYKQIEKAIAAAKRKEEMQKKKELRLQIKAEKELIKKEKAEARKTKTMTCKTKLKRQRGESEKVEVDSANIEGLGDGVSSNLKVEVGGCGVEGQGSMVDMGAVL